MNKKVAVITGGTGGLGKAVTQKFLTQGYHVVVTYFDDKELRNLIESTQEFKSQLTALRINVTDEASLEELADRVKRELGHIDALVCLVGGFAAGTLSDTAGQTFDKMMTLNAKTFLLTCAALVPLMEAGKKEKNPTWRHIVAVAARPALLPTKGLGIYAASKAAVVSLVKTLSLELLENHVAVNAIAPSTIDTPMNRKSMPKADFSSWVTPEQIAETIFFLSSEATDATSGTVVPVYGRA